MGASRRRNVRAWRRLDDASASAGVVAATEDAARGLDAVARLDDAALFRIDATPGRGAKKPGAEERKAPKKQLRVDAILSREGLAKPVPWGDRPNKPTGVQRPPAKAKAKAAPPVPKPKAQKLAGRATVAAATASAAALRGDDVDDLAARGEAVDDVWGAPMETPKVRRKHKPAENERQMVAPPAVVVEAPGCSYNPDPESHAEAIAAAEAAEATKLNRDYLRPKPPPKYVPWSAQDEMDELGLLQVDVPSDDDEEEDDDEGEDGAGGGGDAPPTALATPTKSPAAARAEIDGGGRGSAKFSTAAMTNAEANRKRRAKERDAEERRAKEARRMMGDLGQLKKLAKELDAEEEERKANRERRAAEQAERMVTKPLRLSRNLFEAQDVHVLTTDEAEEGSLRTLKAPPMSALLVDRYKNVQRRGMLEVGRKQNLGRPSRKIKRVERDKEWEKSRVFSPPCPKPANK